MSNRHTLMINAVRPSVLWQMDGPPGPAGAHRGYDEAGFVRQLAGGGELLGVRAGSKAWQRPLQMAPASARRRCGWDLDRSARISHTWLLVGACVFRAFRSYTPQVGF